MVHKAVTCKFDTLKANRYMDIIKPSQKQENALKQQKFHFYQSNMFTSTQYQILLKIFFMLPMHGYVHTASLISQY